MINHFKSSGAALLLFCSSMSFSQPYAQPGKIDYALQAIKYAYVDTINEKKITDDAIRAMVKDLDPHSVYIPVEEMREMNEPLVGKFEGVGIQFNILNDTIMITQTIAGGPSEKLGLRQGDRIVKVDGVVKAGIKITNNDVLKLLRGDKGTKVTVGILRRGNADLIDYTITRDQIPLYSVDATYMVTPKVGYIKISRFAESTVDEFKSALAKLKEQGMESLVLDLQANGGGYLNSAVKLSDEFLSDGKKIVFTRGRTTMSEDFNSTSTGGWEKGKLAILIDESSASASEIVSGAIQDWDRGLIIGRRSFGKGLVQKPIPLPDGSAIRLTVAHYYTPSGRCIQKPYELGDEEEYEMDFANRIKNGELTNPDSIHFSDSTKYFTNNKRLVRGGGGIMPDVFVPLDTTEFSAFFTDLRRQNAFSDFVLTWVDNNRADLKSSYPTLADFNSKFSVSEKFMNDFLANAEKLKVKSDSAGLKLSYDLIKLNIKAVIAQNLWSTEGAVEIYNARNKALKKAVDALNDNTFEKLKIAGK
ncbi:MAG: S41 family peptidase [Bacteroidetes bacterium]|nr:S41 family peptidase [Bacteroidota bacterium]